MRLQRGPASVLPKLLGVNSRLFPGAQSLIVNLVPSFPLLSTLTIIAMMVQKKSAGVPGYEAPTMFATEVTVENGFAASVDENTATFGINDYEEGITF